MNLSSVKYSSIRLDYKLKQVVVLLLFRQTIERLEKVVRLILYLLSIAFHECFWVPIFTDILKEAEKLFHVFGKFYVLFSFLVDSVLVNAVVLVAKR